MSKKRVTLTEKSPKKQEVKVYPRNYTKRGVDYFCWVCRWKKEGKWKSKEFKERDDAETFKRGMDVSFLNQASKQQLVLSTLTKEQTRESEQAFDDLGNTYSMAEAIAFFLKHHRATGYEINLTDGVGYYLDGKERDGVRDTTIKRVRSMLKRFCDYCDNQSVNATTSPQIQSFLSSLTSAEGSPAKRKTFNNYRNEIASFFKWAAKKDLSTNRPWLFHDPLEGIDAHSNKRVAEERPEIATTDPDTVRELFTYLMSYKEGKMVKYFALAYFGGMRPSTDQGEIVKLAVRADELINLTTGVINLPADVTKTKDRRQIHVSDNLMAWMMAYDDLPICPANLKNDYRHIREKFGLQNDETRHSFISYHVALHRSMGETALQAGNSESMIKKHYLRMHTADEGSAFFSIVPDMAAGAAVFSEIEAPTQKFKIV